MFPCQMDEIKEEWEVGRYERLGSGEVLARSINFVNCKEKVRSAK